MFTFDTVIDTVQTGKKQFVKTFVNNEKIADALNEFIDAQTQYTKQAVSVGTKTATTLGKETLNAMETAVKFDYAKLNSDMLKALQAFTKTAK
jgi:hypothetical protein